MSVRVFFRKYKVPLFIFLISIFIWIHVKTEMIYEEVFPVTVIPTNVNPEFVITNNYTAKVLVKFQGKGKNLIALRNTDIDILVDLNQTSKTGIIERLNLKNIRISPPIVNIVPLEFVEQDTIHFAQSPLRYKKVPVVNNVTIKTKAGYTQVGQLKLSPAEITISGPENIIKELEQIDTKELTLSDIQADVSHFVELVNPYPERIVLSTKEVEFSADVQLLGEKVIEDVPVQLTNVPADTKVSVIPSALSLKISGGVDIISQIDRNDIFAYIDYQRYSRSKNNSLPATIKIPEDISFSDVYPKLFQIKNE